MSECGRRKGKHENCKESKNQSTLLTIDNPGLFCVRPFHVHQLCRLCLLLWQQCQPHHNIRVHCQISLAILLACVDSIDVANEAFVVTINFWTKNVGGKYRHAWVENHNSFCTCCCVNKPCYLLSIIYNDKLSYSSGFNHICVYFVCWFLVR